MSLSKRIITMCGQGKTLEEGLRDDRLLRWPEDNSKTFYVDTSGSDTASGLSPGQALLTLTAAIAKCTDYARDTIYILNIDSANEAAWPISVNKAGVRILGAPGGGYMPRYTGGQILDSVGDTACLTIDANHVRIVGLEFRAGASHAGIEFVTAGVGRHGIYRCVFTTGLYGVWATALSMPAQGPTIQDCLFVSNLTADGIRYYSNGPFARFTDNIFASVGGIAINCAGSSANHCYVLRNSIGLLTATAGKAIVLGTQCKWWIINKNYANYSKAEMTNNPYLDNSAQVNNWILNYRNITATLPA